MTIEWKEVDNYQWFGKVGGKKLFEISEQVNGEFRVSFQGKNVEYLPTIEAAKAKAEQLFKEWKEAAGLISLSEIYSCDKCGGKGKIINPDWWHGSKGDRQALEEEDKRIISCDCLKNPTSLASINRAVKEEGR
jgi:hypothetical protein